MNPTMSSNMNKGTRIAISGIASCQKLVQVSRDPEPGKRMINIQPIRMLPDTPKFVEIHPLGSR